MCRVANSSNGTFSSDLLVTNTLKYGVVVFESHVNHKPVVMKAILKDVTFLVTFLVILFFCCLVV